MWTFLAGVLTFLYVYYWWPRRHLLRAAYRLPGPPAFPLVGNMLMISNDPEKSFASFVKIVATYGTVFRFWAGSKLCVILTDPVDAQSVLGNSKVRDKDDWLTSAMATFLGDGLLTSRGEKWKLHRKLITPAFATKILRMYIEIFGRRSESLLETLDTLADGQTFDVHHLINLLTADTICETVLGTSVRVPETIGRQLYDAFQLGGELVMKRIASPWLLIGWIYQHTHDGRRARELKERLNAFGTLVIADKLEAFRQKGAAEDDETTKTFIDVVVETSETEGSVMSTQDIMDEVCTLAVAAVETTSTITAALVTLMGIHPEIQDKVIAEVDEIFGKDRRLPTLADLNRMSTLERCIKEGLRLFPVGPFLAREINEDIPISGGLTVPRGSTAMVFTYGLQHDARNYPDPEAYIPDRWLAENSEGRHPYAFLPFGAGQRNCIGQKYAMLQMKTTLSSILRRFRITTKATLKELQVLKAGTAVQSAVGYNVELVRRSTEGQHKTHSVKVTKL